MSKPHRDVLIVVVSIPGRTMRPIPARDFLFFGPPAPPDRRNSKPTGNRPGVHECDRSRPAFGTETEWAFLPASAHHVQSIPALAGHRQSRNTNAPVWS